MKLDKNDYKRFEKQIILKKIGFSGQKKINNAKVLIIGMGGLGCPLLTYLASSGVCNIGIVDYDKVELGNLNRQILFNTSDVGKFKVNQAKSKICKIYKKIKIKTSNIKISKKNKSYDDERHLFKHFEFLVILTFRNDIVRELNTKILLFKSSFKPKIVFKTSLDCKAPIIPATGANIPSVSQLFFS